MAPGSRSAVADALRRRLADVDDPRSFSARARRARSERLLQRFPDLAELSVIDLGGTFEHWSHFTVQPKHLVLVNFGEEITQGREDVEVVLGDACELPAALEGREFDLVYSNSVLEHVGGAWRRAQFAESVRRLAPRHWVQTPYRYFPLEPHWLFPGFQFLPLQTRIAITRRWQIGHRHEPDAERAMRLALEVELVSLTEMRHLFPDSEIVVERMAGLPKSLTATRG